MNKSRNNDGEIHFSILYDFNAIELSGGSKLAREMNVFDPSVMFFSRRLKFAVTSSGAGLESGPGANNSNIEDSLKEERLYLTTEGGEQGRLPVLILSLKGNKHQRRPAVVLLHGTGSNKESLCPLLKAYASRGYVAVAIDSRYHGERAHSATAYQDALVSAWKTGKTMPFIYDTVWDLIKLADYLTQRERM